MVEYRRKNKDRIRTLQRENHLKNRETRLARQREYYRENKQAHADSARRWVEANSEKLRSYQATYRKRNHVRLKEYQQRYYQTHRERRIRQQMEQDKANPNRRIASTLRKQLNRWVKKSSGRHSTNELLGCSFAEFRAWIESKFKRGMNWDNYGRLWHLDHIMPCCAFDLTRPEQVKICFHFTNLQPLSARENLSKNRRITEPQLHLPL